MKPRLSASQGQLIRALGFHLAGRRSPAVSAAEPALIVESIVSQPWSSLTFVGERHHLVVRLASDASAVGREIDGAALGVAETIVAVEHADWHGAQLTLGVLVIAVHDHPAATS